MWIPFCCSLAILSSLASFVSLASLATFSRCGYHFPLISTQRDNSYIERNKLEVKQLCVRFANMVIMMMKFSLIVSLIVRLPSIPSLFPSLLLGRQSQSIGVSVGLSQPSERFLPDKSRESIKAFLLAAVGEAGEKEETVGMERGAVRVSGRSGRSEKVSKSFPSSGNTRCEKLIH